MLTLVNSLFVTRFACLVVVGGIWSPNLNESAYNINIRANIMYLQYKVQNIGLKQINKSKQPKVHTYEVHNETNKQMDIRYVWLS